MGDLRGRERSPRKGPEAERKLGGGPQRTPGIRNEWYDLEATSQPCFYSEALKKRSNTGIFAFLKDHSSYKV